jgi:Co/Zn/Cd efflux system component
MPGCHDADGCCPPDSPAPAEPGWRRILWIALIANAGMFAAETGTGVFARSSSLQADALDFLGDAANYGISLGVAGMALAWRARAALLKGGTLLLFALGVVASTGWRLRTGGLPEAEVMAGVAALALAVNLAIAFLLFRFRGGDSNMRSAWICSRNDAVGNLTVLLAAVGVFGTGTAWPDIIVAGTMAALGISGGWQIVRAAWRELRIGTEPSLA